MVDMWPLKTGSGAFSDTSIDSVAIAVKSMTAVVRLSMPKGEAIAGVDSCIMLPASKDANDIFESAQEMKLLPLIMGSMSVSMVLLAVVHPCHF